MCLHPPDLSLEADRLPPEAEFGWHKHSLYPHSMQLGQGSPLATTSTYLKGLSGLLAKGLDSELECWLQLYLLLV